MARALSAAAGTDTDADKLWSGRMQLLRSGFLVILRRLEDAGGLNPDWTPDSAADWCYSLSHVDAWCHLVIERHWSAQMLVERMLARLIRDLTRPITGKPGPRGKRPARP